MLGGLATCPTFTPLLLKLSPQQFVKSEQPRLFPGAFNNFFQLPIGRLIEMFATNPQKIMRITPWGLFEGSDAHLTIVDPQRRWKYDVAKTRSKSRNSPFHGRELTGKAVATIVHGRIVYEDRS